MTEILVVPSYLGDITLAADKESLKGLWLPGQQGFIKSCGEFLPNESNSVLREAESWLRAYFEGMRPSPASLPLAPEGSDFQKTVWNILLKIPYGSTETYGSIAQKAAGILGKERMSAQAVGGAVGSNPISIIIPCHRVMGAGGRLTGYAGGIDYKIRLLQQEGIDTSGFIMPK